MLCVVCSFGGSHYGSFNKEKDYKFTPILVDSNYITVRYQAKYGPLKQVTDANGIWYDSTNQMYYVSFKNREGLYIEKSNISDLWYK